MSDPFQIRSVNDFARAEEEFQLKKQLLAQKLAAAQKGSDLPAALQIANEYAKRRAAGDIQGMNDIALAAKSFDKGVVYGEDGLPVAMQGYGDAVGSIAGTKKTYEANAQNMSDLQYDPLIAGREAQQRMNVELGNAADLERQKTYAKLQADAMGAADKKSLQADGMQDLITRAEATLPSATGGALSNYLYKMPMQLVGISTEQSQADKQLKIISAGLVSNVPRMEGPQSNYDVQLYREAAGDIGNENIPIQDRLAALQTIKELNNKYASQPQAIPQLTEQELYGEYQGSTERPDPMPPMQAPSLYQKGEQEFNARKAKTNNDPLGLR